MYGFFLILLPELILITAACALFLLGVSSKASARRMAPVVAVLALLAAGAVMAYRASHLRSMTDPWNTMHLGPFSAYVKLLTAAVGVLLVLLAWPTNADATGSASFNVGGDAGEFFALMLLSLAGVMLVAGANDIILLFLGIELASIPTYIMVSMSRPIPAAQEAGVKYFFLGAMAAAVMLFGFSYLYGTTGSTHLDRIGEAIAHAHRGAGDGSAMGHWQLLAVVMLVAGFAFKIAAVPLHAYAGDVYQGAATPVTAFLAFVPKTTGFVALIKVLAVVGGVFGSPGWQAPPQLVSLLWVLAVLTMTVGNVLGLLQSNVKRVFAYSSIAHSGYMLVGLTAFVATGDRPIQDAALQGVLFYLAAYGIMNAGAFGVLMLLPRREGEPRPAAAGEGSAETFKDLAGAGRRHAGLGMAMAVCCFSLIGLPLTVGFLGKFFLIRPALQVGTTMMNWLVVLTVVNAAISAAYYLRIIATMFMPAAEQEPRGFEPVVAGSAPPGGGAAAYTTQTAPAPARPGLFGFAGGRAWPVTAAVLVSVIGTLLLGVFIPAINGLSAGVRQAANLQPPTPQQAAEAPVAARADGR